MLSQLAGAWPASTGVVPLNQIKDNGQVFLRIRRGNPAGILGMATEKTENVRHGESLWFVQHVLWGSGPDEGETTRLAGSFHAA